jgi:hypothetical protein
MGPAIGSASELGRSPAKKRRRHRDEYRRWQDAHRCINCTVAPIPTSTNPLLIGIRNLAAGQAFGFNGLIDDVAIWNRALTTSEISFL